MQQTPNNKSPGGAVPKSTKEHDDYKIKRRTVRADLVATERNVKVIAKKSGKRNVPSPPKIREADRGIRETKVVLQMESECEGSADRAKRIAGEIEKDLPGKCQHAGPRVERNQRSGITEHAIGTPGEQGIGKNNFLKQSQSHQRQSPEKLPVF